VLPRALEMFSSGCLESSAVYGLVWVPKAPVAATPAHPSLIGSVTSVSLPNPAYTPTPPPSPPVGLDAVVGQELLDDPCQGDYPVCSFVSNYEDWAKFAACKMGGNPIPTSLILVQWGNESGWGGGDISVCYNPGNQGATCGIGSGCYPSGYTEVCFCSLEEGVAPYANLMSKGYPFVAATHQYDASAGNYAEGVNEASIALGQGYSPTASLNTYIDYCGWSGTPPESTPRLWAASEYNDGNGPGSALYDTIHANSCLSDLDSTT
jgi:hypothetical protein